MASVRRGPPSSCWAADSGALGFQRRECIYKPSRVQNPSEAGYTSEVHPAATWRLMCFVQRTTCRQKGSSQTQGLWTRVVRKTVSVGSLERCLRHGDQQLSSSRAVHGPPTRGHSLYHGTRLALVAQKLPHCQFWESEPFLDSWCKWLPRELVQSTSEYNCRSSLVSTGEVSAQWAWAWMMRPV